MCWRVRLCVWVCVFARVCVCVCVRVTVSVYVRVYVRVWSVWTLRIRAKAAPKELRNRQGRPKSLKKLYYRRQIPVFLMVHHDCSVNRHTGSIFEIIFARTLSSSPLSRSP